MDFGVSNVAPISWSFGPNSGTITDVLGGGLLQIDQAYGFAVENVLKIATTVTNTSGSPPAVRLAAMLILTLIRTEFPDNHGRSPNFADKRASYFGFEYPSPLFSYTYPQLAAGCSVPTTSAPPTNSTSARSPAPHRLLTCITPTASPPERCRSRLGFCTYLHELTFTLPRVSREFSCSRRVWERFWEMLLVTRSRKPRENKVK